MSLNDAVRLIKAAGFEVSSYGEGSNTPPHITLKDGRRILEKDVADWLAKQGRTPTQDALRIAALEEELHAVRFRLREIEDASETHLHSLCAALAGRPGEPLLCFASSTNSSSGTAWFTSLRIDKQWGDDWNDAPHHCNAGSPCDYRRCSQPDGKHAWKTVWPDVPYIIAALDWTGLWIANPSDKSAQEINQFCLPWLRAESVLVEDIHAGTPLSVFRKLIAAGGGSTSWHRRVRE